MTEETKTSDEEQSTAPAPAPAAPADESARRARVDRRNAELAGQVRDLQEKLGTLAELEKQAHQSAEALTQLQSQFAEKATEADELKRQSRRRDFSDNVLSGISHHHQEAARLALAGLLVEESDVYDYANPEAKIGDMARAAREALRQRAPSLFSASPRQGLPDASRPDFSKYRSYGEVPAEMRAQLSDEDFKRLNGQPTSANLLFAHSKK
ncbi:MAG: hypothetical protein ACTSX8_10890 [Alphaproteobacteria bacterium]